MDGRRGMQHAPFADDPRMAQSRMRMRTAAVLYLTAGVLVVAALLLSAGHATLGYVIPVVALVTGVVLLPVSECVYVPIWVNDLLSLAGSMLIGLLTVHVNPELADVPGVFVVYVAAYAYFFYDRRRALFHAAFAALAYGAGLASVDVDFWAARWLVIAGASIVAAILVTRLAETDRRAAETQRDAAERTRRLAMTRELLLVAVSHELRTPLTMVAGTAAILNERHRELEPSRVEELLASQDVNAQRLVRLVEDLDALHQLSQEALVAAREPVELRACCRDAVPPEIREHVDLRLDVPDVTVRVDPRFIRRIVDNLLRNAVRHTPPGTEVLLQAWVEGAAVVLAVSDAGAGVPDEFKAAIFEPFVRLHTERTGSGVGLALVAALAKAHGGSATVTDRAGGGSVFRVALLQDVDRAALASGPPPGPSLVGD